MLTSDSHEIVHMFFRTLVLIINYKLSFVNSIRGVYIKSIVDRNDISQRNKSVWASQVKTDDGSLLLILTNLQ